MNFFYRIFNKSIIAFLCLASLFISSALASSEINYDHNRLKGVIESRPMYPTPLRYGDLPFFYNDEERYNSDEIDDKFASLFNLDNVERLKILRLPPLKNGYYPIIVAYIDYNVGKYEDDDGYHEDQNDNSDFFTYDLYILSNKYKVLDKLNLIRMVGLSDTENMGDPILDVGNVYFHIDANFNIYILSADKERQNTYRVFNVDNNGKFYSVPIDKSMVTCTFFKDKIHYTKWSMILPARASNYHLRWAKDHEGLQLTHSSILAPSIFHTRFYLDETNKQLCSNYLWAYEYEIKEGNLQELLWSKLLDYHLLSAEDSMKDYLSNLGIDTSGKVKYLSFKNTNYAPFPNLIIYMNDMLLIQDVESLRPIRFLDELDFNDNLYQE